MGDLHLFGKALLDGRTAPRTSAMDTFRLGSGGGGGTSLGECEHNNNSESTLFLTVMLQFAGAFFMPFSW